MELKVHLVFDGTCEEALNFYSKTLNGKVDFIFRKKEDKTADVAEADREKVSYMIIKTPHFELAGEDADTGSTVIAGNNNKLVLVFRDMNECRRVFDAFSQGANVAMPLQPTFFCEGLGELTDRYGISWLIMMSDEGYQA